MQWRQQNKMTVLKYVHQEIYFSRRRSRRHRSERRTVDFARRWFDRQTARWYFAVQQNYLLAGRPGLCPWLQSLSDPRKTDQFETYLCRGRGRTVQWRPACGSVYMIQNAAPCFVLTAHTHTHTHTHTHNRYNVQDGTENKRDARNSVIQHHSL